MRVLAAMLLALPIGTPISSAADRPAIGACLSAADAHDAVSSGRVVASGEAIETARKAVPGGEVLRAALCRDADALVYRVTVLGRGGRVVRVTLDATSGKVADLR